MFGFGKKKNRLKGARVAFLVADGVEQSQLDAAVKQLRSAGAEIFIIAPRSGKIQALNALKTGAKVPVDGTLEDTHPASFAALVIPGGTIAADRLRQNVRALEFIRSFDRNAKPIAALGHAAWVLASAGVTSGRKLTGWPGIKDDATNAGAEWLDEPYVLDGHLLTGRTSRDLKQFSKQLRKHFASNIAA